MPVYESEILTHDEMQKMAKYKKCQCGGALLVAWSANHSSYMLRCASDLNHDEFVRPAHISNYDLPGYNMPGVMKRKERELVTKYGEEKTTAMVRAGGGNALALLDEVQAKDIILTIWPKAPPVEIKKAALICAQYGLNPLMKHIYLIPFGNAWTTVMGIKASRIIARRAGAYAYLDDTPRIMTREEQIRIMGEVDDTRIWAITKLKSTTGNTAQGIGSWPKDKQPQGTDKGNTKLNMAMIRSERQALERLFPDSLPDSVDVGDERFVEVDGGQVDTTTGEIIKPLEERQEIEETAAIEAEFTEQATAVSEPETKAQDKKLKSPNDIKSFGDLYEACIRQWPSTFKTSKDVLREIGVSSQAEVAQTPGEVYATILSIRQ